MLSAYVARCAGQRLGGTISFPTHHETADARAIREAYNAKAASAEDGEASSSADAANQSCWAELPLIPGSAWIELQHVSVEELTKPVEEVVETPRGRLDFLLSFNDPNSAAAILSAGLHRGITNITNFLYGREAGDERTRTRRRRRDSVEEEVVPGAPVISALDASIMMSRSYRSSSAYLDDTMPPLTAEDAKAKATRAARQAEYLCLKQARDSQGHKLSSQLEA